MFLPFRASVSSFLWFFLFSDLFSSRLSLLSVSALLCFSSVHIVGNLASKFPSINVLYSNLWLPVQAGERPWMKINNKSQNITSIGNFQNFDPIIILQNNRCNCKKNERIFLRQTASSSWVLGAFWIYYKMDILKLIMQNGFWFFKLLRAPRSLFLIYKSGLKIWLKRAHENYFDEKKKTIFTNFQHLFCSEKAFQGQVLVEKFPGNPFCRLRQIMFKRKISGLLLNGRLQPHPPNSKGNNFLEFIQYT